MTDPQYLSDPRLTSEEAKALVVNCTNAITWSNLDAHGVADAFEPAVKKLETALSAPEHTGVEKAVEFAAERIYGKVVKSLLPADAVRWDKLPRVTQDAWREVARSLVAAIQPFLTQPGDPSAPSPEFDREQEQMR